MYTDFPYKTQPYTHQHDCWELSRDVEAYAYFMEMGCIAEDAEVTIGNATKLTMKELFDQCTSGIITSAQTKSFDDGRLIFNEILGVFYSGIRETVSITTFLGFKLRLTPDHEVLTHGKGWVPACSLHVNDSVLVVKKSTIVSDKIVLIEGAGKLPTYDLSMRSPMNSFVASGIIVHNCGKFSKYDWNHLLHYKCS